MKTKNLFHQKGIILLLTFVLVSCLSCAKMKETVTFREANELYNDEKFDKAITKYKDLTKGNYYKKEAWLQLGYSNLALVRSSLNDEEVQKYSEQAIEAFKEYLKINPGDAKVEDYIFNTYMDSRNYDKVLDFLYQKFEQNPKDIRAIQLIIQTFENIGEIQQAIEWYQKRCEVTPNDADAYYSFAVFYWRNSYYNRKLDEALRATFVDEGIELAKKAVELNPEFADAYTYWNLLLREKVKYTKSKKKQEQIMEEANMLRDKGRDIRLSQQTEEQGSEMQGESPNEQIDNTEGILEDSEGSVGDEGLSP